jgi:hypothetical protein
VAARGHERLVEDGNGHDSTDRLIDAAQDPRRELRGVDAARRDIARVDGGPDREIVSRNDGVAQRAEVVGPPVQGGEIGRDERGGRNDHDHGTDTERDGTRGTTEHGHLRGRSARDARRERGGAGGRGRVSEVGRLPAPRGAEHRTCCYVLVVDPEDDPPDEPAPVELFDESDERTFLVSDVFVPPDPPSELEPDDEDSLSFFSEPRFSPLRPPLDRLSVL